jgi:putative spermidine/putrescine transport system permease protein
MPAFSASARLWGGLLATTAGLVLAFLMLPILVIVPLSFNAGRYLIFPLEGFSLRWYADFLGSPIWRSALANSLLIAAATTIVSTILGTPPRSVSRAKLFRDGGSSRASCWPR